MSHRYSEQNNKDSAQQDRLIQHHNQPVNYHSIGKLTAKIIVLCFATFYFGFNLTNLSSFTNLQLTQIWGPHATNTLIYSLLLGLIPVGSFVGGGLTPILMHCLTRKQFVLFINLLAIIIEGVIQINNIYVLLICRFFQGIFSGCYMALIPIYIDQIAPNQVVGSFGVFTQLFVVVGLVISYGTGLILTKLGVHPFIFFRIMMTFTAVTLVIQSILLLFDYVPESPFSLIKKQQNEKAKEVINQFIQDQYVQQVFKHKCLQVEASQHDGEAVVEDADGHHAHSEKIIYSMRAIILGFELPFMQQLTGINSVVTQANRIVSKVIPSFSEYVSLVINFIQLLATLSAVFVLAKHGRKITTLMGNLLLGIIDILIGILFVFQSWQPSGYFIFVLLIFYNIVYGVTLGPVVWLYVPEIIPSKIVPFATMTNWFGCSICVLFTPIVIQINGGNPYPVFMFFGVVTLLLYIMNYFLMVETKGKTKVQIANSFRKQE